MIVFDSVSIVSYIISHQIKIRQRMATSTIEISNRCLKAISRMEKIVQRDEGKRGMIPLVQPNGTLASIAISLYQSTNVILLTGFPCLMQHDIPTETDGPSGTVAICRALTRIGGDSKKCVTLITDECNAPVLEACASLSLMGSPKTSWKLVSFPSEDYWNEEEQTKLLTLANQSDHILALERASKSLDNNAYTMSGKIMGRDLLAPFDQLFIGEKNYGTSAIGDGGNEMGMANAKENIFKHIPNGTKIASAAPSDNLLVASVSNWGGYAVAAALEVLAKENQMEGDDTIWPLLVTCMEEIAVVAASVEAGARDGITGRSDVTVDGMGMDVSIGILEELKCVVDEF